MIPGLDKILLTGGQGGLNIAPSATATAGPVHFGAFNFQPKGGPLPPAAWVAIAVLAALALVLFAPRR